MSEKNILLKLLSSEPQAILANITDAQWAGIIDLAGKQHVAAYLYYHLQEVGALGLIPESVKEALQQSFKINTFRNMALIAEFRRIADEFKQNGIDVIGLKGLQLVQDDIYPRIGLRYMRDIDLLVPRKEIKDAYICSVKLGYECEKTITEQDFNILQHHLYQQFHPQKHIILELHGYLSEDKNIDMNELWENARVCEGHNHMYLDIEDLLLHLCMHISYSDLFKMDLRHYLDIYMILKNRGDEINWDKFLIRAENRGLTKGVLMVMQITSELFKCKLPDKLLVMIKDEPDQAELIKQAIDFMWQYDKSSKGYEQYKSKVFLSDEPILGRFFRRIFISKDELSFYYSLDPNSWSVYIYYFRRVYDLCQRHFFDLIKIKTDSKQIDATNKTKILHAYLFDK
ncbi:MAG: nucleotidyltransferase family protein [Campylobacterales bacterium]|nr:nucleotidyltransferase family protein [Campylobacterales bacterium]